MKKLSPKGYEKLISLFRSLSGARSLWECFNDCINLFSLSLTQLVYGATGFLIDSDVMFNSNLIGERFFITREAAEQALKEREAT